MGYTPSFTPQYENGWEDLPSETSPITAEAFNAYDDAIENIEDYLASDESQANLANAYDKTATYEAGDYVIYGGDLYKCLEDIDEPEEWDSTKWESCLITNEMGSGGGSNVSITPTLSTGTKIADFEIDGESGELYAPTGGGGNANIWTGTQAELEEVFDELEEGTQINITDDEQEVVEGGTIYSEEEQVIGLWKDNKPLYQKTITHVNANKTDNVTVSSEDISIQNIEGWASAVEGGNDRVPLNYPSFLSAYQINARTVSITVDTQVAYKYVTLTIQYTKSTDAPLDAVVGKKTMYIASSDCYSTEEKEIGCWTNGKPIYQKTLTTTQTIPFTANTWVKTEFAKGDMDTIIGGFLLFDGQTPSLHEAFSFGFVDGLLAINTGRAWQAEIGARLVIQYTKTTDTAGSGSYSPASGKAVHYSTDEQVIGTWIDGKTLYRIVKEIAFSSLTTDGDQRIYDYRNDFPNCDIKKISGYSISETYGICNLGARSYKQNTQNGTYYEFSQYYGFPALRSSQGLSDINTSIKPDLVLTFEYTKTV